MREPGFETLLAHHGENPARYEGAVVPPIYQASLFTAPDSETFETRSGRPDLYEYTRFSNPTTDILQNKLAAIERTEACRCFGSGCAAVAAAIMHCAKAGDHVVAVETIYGPTRAILTSYLADFGIEATFIPGADPQQFLDATRKTTKLYYLETPSTLVFNLQDLGAIASLAKERGIATAVDNSWASPYFQNPAEFGIDLVVHSATKYLGGHSDIVAGVVMGSKAMIDAIGRNEGMLLGGILDPFAAWLMLRGVRTLSIRLERHQSNALTVARYLEAHPRVDRVNYPGLASHPQYELGRRQMRGFSGLLSFTLKDGGRPAAHAFVDKLRYFGIGVSWGGFESLAIPVPLGPERRWGARLHVGIETVDDLIEDLDNALK